MLGIDNIKALNNIKALYKKEYLNDRGYNINFADAYKLEKKVPSMWLVAYYFIINFEVFIEQYDTLIYKDKDCFKLKDFALVQIISECKKINTVNISKEVNNQTVLNKAVFYDFIEALLNKYIDLFVKNNMVSCKNIDNLVNDYISILDKLEDIPIPRKEEKYPMFKDVVGLEKAKKTVNERVIQPSLHREVYEKYDVKVGGGILLYGLPGTGKTMFAQAVANEIDGFFMAVKSSDLKSKWYGETETKVKELFDEARKHEIAVLFFDEFEAIGMSRDKDNADITASSIVPELLAQMQGFQKNENIMLFIAATNRPWDIDSALLRPGRLDSLVYVDLPNYEARLLMLKNYLSKVTVEQDILEYLAKYTETYNGSDIKNICDNLVRVIINKEISGEKETELTFEDCVLVLKDNKSSVSFRDQLQMKRFIDQYDN